MQLAAGKTFYCFFLALIICLFIGKSGYSQESTNQGKIYGMPLFYTPKLINNVDEQNPSPTPNLNNPTTNTTPTTEDLSFMGKLGYGFKKAYLTPTSYFYPLIPTLRQQMSTSEPPGKTPGDKAADDFSRYGINLLTATNKSFLANGIYPALLKQDPHYYPSQKQGFGARTKYALSRVIITRGDNGKNQFNYSLFAGDLSASALANLYERSTITHDRIGTAATFRRFGSMVAFDFLRFVVLKEFGPDIKKFILRK